MTLRMGELFAGYGGLGLGVQAAIPDVELAWYSDVCRFGKEGAVGHHDPHRGACAIMAHHHPDVPNLGDVSAVDWSRVEPVDILTGGSPCQDLSHAGKRAGMTEGTRSNLWVAMREAIAQLRPGLVVWENVRGAYSAEADSNVEQCEGCLGDRSGQPVLRALGRVLGDLSDLGYVGGWHGLRAADVGAPHGRFRVFVVARPADSDHRRRREPDTGLGEVPVAHPNRGADVALLPTPTTAEIDPRESVEDWQDKTRRLAERGSPAATLNLSEAVMFGRTKADLTAEALLPTPSVALADGGQKSRSGDRKGELLLGGIVANLDPACPAVDNGEHDPNPSTGSREELPGLRDPADSEAIRQRETGGQDGVPQAQSLLAELREHQDGGHEGGAPRTSSEAPGDFVPGLFGEDPTSRPSRRSEPGEQRPLESGDPLRELPPETSLAGGSSCSYGCGQTCGGHSTQAWGAYEAAIRRWEVCLRRPAPAATTLSAKGNAQLSAHLTEWLMGLPAGHVTDVPGLSRNDMLKALGNGVVSQQCAEAVRFLLGVLSSGRNEDM